ncbi:hypothetical protein C942_02795 [Photobacterium marinum]|uniref:Uncharacterized protein n=1 Tax=Photobacterium marinum TaxID=1056511 RepID=L8J7R4_9GAMM|nr:hypothetical protein C942_02795 [Photobacterium marinum]
MAIGVYEQRLQSSNSFYRLNVSTFGVTANPINKIEVITLGEE